MNIKVSRFEKKTGPINYENEEYNALEEIIPNEEPLIQIR